MPQPTLCSTACSPTPAKASEPNPLMGTIKNEEEFTNRVCQPLTSGQPQTPNIEKMKLNSCHIECNLGTTTMNNVHQLTDMNTSTELHMPTTISSLSQQIQHLHVNASKPISPPVSPRTSQGYFSADDDIGFYFDRSEDYSSKDLAMFSDYDEDDDGSDFESTRSSSSSSTYTSDGEYDEDEEDWNRSQVGSQVHGWEAIPGNHDSDYRHDEDETLDVQPNDKKQESSGRTRVRFSTLLVTEVHTRPRTTAQEHCIFYYGAHELQRMMDDEKSQQTQPRRCIIAGEEEDLEL